MALEQYIQSIEDKLQQLIKKLQQSQADNTMLREQLLGHQEELRRQEATIASLDERLKLAKIATVTQGNGLSEEEDAFRKEVRGKINDYIREIDRCIALLNS
jgi:predicted  nucleic acid-binding Zn-ribbon protein